MPQKRPLHRNVLVKQDEDIEKVNETGLVVNVGGKRYARPESGVVVSVSNSVKASGYVAVGERVFFSKYAGVVVRPEGEELLLLSTNELLGVLEGDDVKIGETNDLAGMMEVTRRINMVRDLKPEEDGNRRDAVI
jgi:chaperonin GroES